MGSIEAGLAGARDQLAATGSLTRRLEDLQLTVGEGPCLDAYSAGTPVLTSDLTAEQTSWLGSARKPSPAGVAAVFSPPLRVGAVRLGTLDLHRATTGPLSRSQLADALALASLATEALLELAEHPDPTHERRVPDDPDPEPGQVQTGWPPDVHADVHVASGMVSTQSSVGVGAALLRIRAYAYARGEPIHQVARRIIDRDLVLRAHDHDDPEDGPAGPDLERD